MSRLLILPEPNKSIDTYIQEQNCSRRGRVQSYLDTAKSVGVSKEEIDVPKSQRLPDGEMLTIDDIQKLIIGNTLRRPCFDMFFDPSGKILATWNDGLWDTRQDIAELSRQKVGLPKPLDVSYAVPVFHEGTWWWSEGKGAKAPGLFRKFDIYPSPFLTEFHFQKNGLLNVKGYNDTNIIWYDVLVLRGNQLPRNVVHWNEISPYTDIQMNLHWERAYNLGPHQRMA